MSPFSLRSLSSLCSVLSLPKVLNLIVKKYSGKRDSLELHPNTIGIVINSVNRPKGLYRIYQNGNIRVQRLYNSVGNLHGLQESFYEDSKNKKLNKMMYINGSKEGEEIDYYPSGNIHRITQYENNEKNGKATEYNHCNIISEKTYKDDILEGPFKDYYLDGTLEEEGNYKNNEKEGKARGYPRRGRSYFIYIYDNGIMNEISKYSTSDGT